MLRCNLKLSTDMMFDKLPEKSIILIQHKVIKTDSGTHKYLFYIWKAAELSQKRQIIRMRHFEIGTWLWAQALPVLADSGAKLLLARGLPEIGCRPAHIMNVSFEILILCDKLCFLNNGLMAPHLYCASLMERKGTKITSAKASTVAYQGKLYLRNSRNTSERLIRRMIGTLVRQCIHIIHFLHGKRRLRNILHDINTIWVWLYQCPAIECIRIVILYLKTFRI